MDTMAWWWLVLVLGVGGNLIGAVYDFKHKKMRRVVFDLVLVAFALAYCLRHW